MDRNGIFKLQLKQQVLLIAKDHNTAREYSKLFPGMRLNIVSRREHLSGISDCVILLCGDYKNHPSYIDIMLQVTIMKTSRQCRVVRVEELPCL